MTGTDSETTTAEGVPQIVDTEDVLGGDPRIEGTRIGVTHVNRRYVDDESLRECLVGVEWVDTKPLKNAFYGDVR